MAEKPPKLSASHESTLVENPSEAPLEFNPHIQKVSGGRVQKMETAPSSSEGELVESNTILERVSNGGRGTLEKRNAFVSVLTKAGKLLGPKGTVPEAKPKQRIEGTEEAEMPSLTHNKYLERVSGGKQGRPPEKEILSEKQEAALEGRQEDKKTTLAEKAGVTKERQAMQAAEEKYLAAYKNFHKTNHVLTRLGKETLQTQSVQALEALKKEYIDASVTYGHTLEDSVRNRIAKKFKDTSANRSTNKTYAERFGDKQGVKTEGKLTAEQYKEKVLERYNRLERFNEIVKPGAEKKFQARVEALDERGQGLFTKGLGLIGKGNAWLEKKAGGKLPARVYKALFVGALVAGGLGVSAAAAGTLGPAALVAAGGYGAWRAGKSLFMGAFAGGVSAYAAGKFEKGGRKKQAEAESKLVDMGRGDAITAGMLSQTHAKRDKLMNVTDETQLQNKKRLVQALVGFGVGGGISSLAWLEMPGIDHALESMSHHGHLDGSHFGKHVSHPESHHPNNQSSHATHPTETKPGAAKVTVVHTHPAVGEGHPAAQAAAPASEYPSVHTTPGEGANHLFTNLHKLVNTPGHHSPLVEAILKKTPQEQAAAFGFPHDNTEGYMQPGDTLEVHGNQLMFSRIDAHGVHHSFPLLEQGKDGSVTVNQHIGDFHKNFFSHHAAAHPTEHAKVEHSGQNPTEATNPTEEVSKSALPEEPGAHAQYQSIHTWMGPDDDTVPRPTTEAVAPHEVAPPHAAVSAPVHESVRATHGTPPPAAPEVQHSAGAYIPPSHAVAPTEVHQPVSSPEVSIPSEHIASIDALHQMNSWGEYHSAPADTLFDRYLTTGTPGAAFRDGIRNVVQESGVGPQPNESVEHFISRATDVIRSGHANHVGVFETTNPPLRIVIKGGDESSRIILGREFMRVNAETAADKHMEPVPSVLLVDENNHGEVLSMDTITSEKVILDPGQTALPRETGIPALRQSQSPAPFPGAVPPPDALTQIS